MRLFYLLVISVLFLLFACNPENAKIETIPEPEPQPEVVDTSFQEPEPFADVDTSDEVSFSEAELEAAFRKEVEQTLVPIYFGYNSFKLSMEATDKLASIADFLERNAGVRILIEGHCDERGSSEYNLGLGENRAKTVKEYLGSLGVAPIRLETTSWGEEKPVEYGCQVEQCHEQNRRVSFVVLSK